MEYYVYAHYVEGEEQPFYIGKGKGNRYKDLSPRNPSWEAYVAGRRVVGEILERFTDEQSALTREVELIAEYGRRDIGTGCLTNRSNGGEFGWSGCEVDREQVSNTVKQLWQTDAYRQKMAEVHQRPEWRDAAVNQIQKIWGTPETREKLLASLKKRSANPEYRQKLSESLKGHPSNVKGTRWVITDEGKGKRIPFTENLPEKWRWGKLDKRSK
jgi:hypothetical protein